jgi:hypothetical protein
MQQFHDSQMYFDTKATDNKKIFTIKFPIDALLSMRWDEKQLKKLNKYDKSSKVSDKLLMLAMIAVKLEKNEIIGEEDEQK